MRTSRSFGEYTCGGCRLISEKLSGKVNLL